MRSEAPADSMTLGERDRAKAEYRARRPDHPVEAGPADLIEVLAELGVEKSSEPALIARRQRVAFHEPLGEADDAELEAAADLHIGAGAPA